MRIIILSYSWVNAVEPLAQKILKPLAVMAGRFKMKDLSLLPIFVFFFPTFCCLTSAVPRLVSTCIQGMG